MKISLIPIGNSKGIRIPQAILKQCGAGKEFQMDLHEGCIILRPVKARGYRMDFNNIARLSDPEIIEMLEKVDPFTIAVSLINADESASRRIYSNMSQRAYGLIKGEVERLSALSARELIIEMHRAKINDLLKEMD